MKALHAEEAEADERPDSLYYGLFWSEDARPDEVGAAEPAVRVEVYSSRVGQV